MNTKILLAKRTRHSLMLLGERLSVLKAQIGELREEQYILEQTLVLLEGVCPECRNPHWPHCNAGARQQ